MNKFITLLFFLGFFVSLSCENNGNAISERQTQLDLLNKNKELWTSHDINQYKLDQSKSCYCYFENGVNNWNLEVRKSGDPFLKFNDELVDKFPEYAVSIDDLFDKIEMELKQDPFPFQIDIQYNSEYGFPELFTIDKDQLMADEEYGYANSNFKVIDCDLKTYTGKLVLKGICMNYVIEVIDGDLDPNLIEALWVNDMTNMSYNNVFALGSRCDFPENIEEGDTFQFSILTDDTADDCAVCEAYSPTPNKALRIQVCE